MYFKIPYLKTITWLLIAITFYFFFLSMALNKIFENIHEDEAQWIWVSQRNFTLLLKSDFANKSWSESYSTFGCNNPKIAQYLIGASLYVGGELNATNWDWSKPYIWNNERGNIPNFRTLFYGRLLMPFWGAGCIILFLFIIARGVSLIPSVLATLFFCLNPFFYPMIILFSARAMQDIPALFFFLLSIALIVSVNLREILDKSSLKSILCVSLLGICLGLSIGTKLNNLPLLIIWLAYLGWITMVDFNPQFRIKKRGILKLIPFGLLSLAVSFAIFILSNPYLYEKSISILFQKIETLLDLQKIVANYKFIYPTSALWSIKDKILTLHSINVLTFVKFGDTPTGYLKWFVYIFELLLVVGVFFIIYRLYENCKAKQIFKLDCLMLIASTVIIVIIANLSWIPLSWDRLLIPFLAPIAIVVGFTIESIIWMFSKLLD
jgi:hypothetical protein